MDGDRSSDVGESEERERDSERDGEGERPPAPLNNAVLAFMQQRGGQHWTQERVTQASTN